MGEGGESPSPNIATTGVRFHVKLARVEPSVFLRRTASNLCIGKLAALP